MLIDDSNLLYADEVQRLIARVNGNSDEHRRLRVGIYQIGHFCSSHFPNPKHYNHYPDLTIEPYGICDRPNDVLGAAPEIEKTIERGFLITVTPIVKANQPAEGGWRWHKWGPYIGSQTPTAEYLYDEPVIENVLVYHVYESLLWPDFIKSDLGREFAPFIPQIMKGYFIPPDGRAILCLGCMRESFHPEDVSHKYCANCDVFFEGP